MSDEIHLVGFMIHSPINHTILSWTDQRDRRVEGLADFGYWQNIARILEDGLFDGIFFADTPGVYDQYRNSRDVPIEYGVCCPPHDPMPLLASMASVTDNLGFAVTLSTAATHPYTAVRTLSTLDYLSRGRIGWNVVTGHLRSEHRALGVEELPHDERYDRADEYMDLCYALWDSWGEDSVLMDRKSGRFADPARVRVVDHQGEYFRCNAPGPVLPSPQGRPVIFQAGSSPRGAAFAAKHAEVVFAIQPTLEAMRRFTERHRKAERSASRERPGGKILFGVQCIVAATEEAAREEQRAITSRITLEAGLSRLSGTLGVDFSELDPDQPMAELETEASRGMMAAMSGMFGTKRLTIREAAMRWGASTGMPQVVGTPVSAADELEHMWNYSGGDGFNLTPTYTPGSFELFVDRVVPLLQRKGIYRKEYAGSTLRSNLLGDD